MHQLSRDNQTKSNLQSMPFFVKPEKRKTCMVLELEYDQQESTSLIGPHTPPPGSLFILHMVLGLFQNICMHLICLLLWCFMAQTSRQCHKRVQLRGVGGQKIPGNPTS